MSEQITPNPSVPSQVVQEVKFPQFVNNLGIIPTSYKDSMSYYECLAWLCKYLEETVIPTLNQNGEAVEELQGLYIELNSYVTNYFDTLDVQEEINNKLDDMVRKGTFQLTLSRYFRELEEQYNEAYQNIDSTYLARYDEFQEEISDLNTRIASVASGSPAGIYATVQALTTADPNHSKIYLVNADGKWYYYNTSNSTWTAGGTYQASVNLPTVNELEEKMDELSPTLTGSLSDTRYSAATPLTNQENGATKYIFSAGLYKYIVVKSYTVLNINIYTFLDSQNNIISYKQATGTSDSLVTTNKIRVPDNATQLVVSVNTLHAPDTVVWIDKNAYIEENTKNIGNNLVTINDFPNKGMINPSGQFVPADGTWYYSDFISIEKCSKIKLKAVYNNLLLNVAYYDEDKTFISGTNTTQGTNLYEAVESEFPSGAVYVVFCSRNTIEYYATLEYYDLFFNVFKLEDKLKTLQEDYDDVYVDYSSLKFACFGDSITSDEVTGTGTKINEELGTILIENFAHGNATCSDWYRGDVTETIESPYVDHQDDDPTKTALYENQNVLSNQVRRCLAKGTDEGLAVSYTHPIAGSITLDETIWEGTGSSEYSPDIIYIAISINDGLLDAMVLDDTETVFAQSYSQLNKHGIASSLRWAIETLQSKFPDSQIFVCSPLQTGKTPQSDARLDYSHTKLKRDIIEKVCQFCSVHFIDSFSDSGFSNMMAHGIASNNNDLVHPTQKWSRNIAKYISQNIKGRYTTRTH